MGGNRSTPRKPTTFGRALAKSFHMAIISRPQLDLNPTISEVKSARRDDCATKAPKKKRKHMKQYTKSRYCKTTTYKSSHFNRAVTLWNILCKSALPSCFSNPNSFKRHVQYDVRWPKYDLYLVNKQSTLISTSNIYIYIYIYIYEYNFLFKKF
jgi:hypothetical protein